MWRHREDRRPPWALLPFLIGALALSGCSSATPGGATESPAQGAQPTPSPAGSPTPAASPSAQGVAQARDLLTKDEVNGFLGEAIDRTTFGGFDLRGVSIQDGWDFAGTNGGFLTVVLVRDGSAQFEEARTTWSPTVAVTGVGDAAFVTEGGAPVVMAALQGSTALYLYTSKEDTTEALKALLETALSRLEPSS